MYNKIQPSDLVIYKSTS